MCVTLQSMEPQTLNPNPSPTSTSSTPRQTHPMQGKKLGNNGQQHNKIGLGWSRKGRGVVDMSISTFPACAAEGMNHEVVAMARASFLGMAPQIHSLTPS